MKETIYLCKDCNLVSAIPHEGSVAIGWVETPEGTEPAIGNTNAKCPN